MTVDYEAVYRDSSVAYDQLVRCEDAAGELELAIKTVAGAGTRSADVGCGTGRITRWLASVQERVYACDVAPSMLARAKEAAAAERWPSATHFAVSDVRNLTIENASVDTVVAGWVVGHFVDFHPHTWREHAGRALGELRRITKPGGRIVLVESLGTGVHEPTPPTPVHTAYFDWLSNEGFALQVLRTDYVFRDFAEAQALTRIFFGELIVGQLSADPSPRLREFTGLFSAEA